LLEELCRPLRIDLHGAPARQLNHEAGGGDYKQQPREEAA